MLVSTNEQQIIDDMIAYLKSNTSLTNFEDGSIIKGIIVAFAKQINRQYQTFQIRGYNGYISSATGMYLDMIGTLVNCARFAGETDENYRYRIVHQIEVVASSNETAIKFRCLAISGVKQVEIRNYARGIGTFDAYIITDDPITSSDILTEAQNIIEECQAVGINGRAVSQTPIPLDLKIKLITNGTVTPTIKGSVKTSIEAYINTIALGGTMIADQVTKAILNSSKDILQFNYKEIKINGRILAPANYPTASHERLYLREIVIV